MSATGSYESATEIRSHLHRLELERLEAKSVGLDDCGSYMAQLDDEIAHCRSAFLGAAVTELAVLRGELHGRQLG
jgi:hypothetical protein